MESSEILPIKFFLSKTSLSYEEDLAHFEVLLSDLKDVMPIEYKIYEPSPEVICVEDHPEAAEEYNITGLPMLVIRNHQFLGISNLGKIIDILKVNEDATKS